MKKSLLVISLALLALMFTTPALQAGKPFEGVVTFKITYPDSKFSESQLAQFPKTLTVAIKGAFSRQEIVMPMGSQVEIFDYTTKSKVQLLNLMGQKYAIKSTTEEIEKENADQPKPTVELSNETKVIAGYTCKKAIVTVDDDGIKSTFEVFYTSELGSKVANFDNPVYKDIDGVLLEFTMKTPQFVMKFVATSIEKKSISSKEFEIPSDYVITTQEELKKKFGGGME
jgi:GLPGLI family protein